MNILERVHEYCSENESGYIEDADLAEEIFSLTDMYLLNKEGEMYIEDCGDYGVVKIAIGAETAEAIRSGMCMGAGAERFSMEPVEDGKKLINRILFNQMYLCAGFETEDMSFVVPSDIILENQTKKEEGEVK